MMIQPSNTNGMMPGMIPGMMPIGIREDFVLQHTKM